MNPALTLRRLVWVPLALFFPVAASSARTWTDREGRGIEAEFVRMEGDAKVVIDKEGKEFAIPLARLSDADRQWLKEKVAIHDKATADKDSPKKSAPDKDKEAVPRTTPLTHAIRVEDFDGALKHITPEWVNQPDAGGYHPLTYAVYTRNKDMVSALLKAGADPNTIEHNGKTALFVAANLGRAEIIEILHQHDAKYPSRDNPHQPAAAAVRADALAALRMLVEKYPGIDFGAGWPWPKAVWEQFQSLGGMSPLYTRGPLMFAVMAGYDGIARFLVAHGAATDIRLRDARTALHIASANRKCSALLVGELISAGLDPFARSYGAHSAPGTPLEFAVMNGSIKKVRAMTKSINPLNRAEDYRRAVLIASAFGQEEVMAFLSRELGERPPMIDDYIRSHPDPRFAPKKVTDVPIKKSDIAKPMPATKAVGPAGKADAGTIAVISTPSLHDHASVLTSLLSATDGLTVLERDEIDALLGEQLLKRFGPKGALQPQPDLSLIPAAQLVVLQELIVSGKRFIKVELLSTPTRVTEITRVFRYAPPDPAWVREQLAPLVAAARRIGDRGDRVVALSQVPIAPANPTPECLELVRYANLLMPTTLSAHPDAVLLSLRQMRHLEIENATGGSDSYWKAAWLIEGSLNYKPGSEVRFLLAATPMNKGKRLEVAVDCRAEDMDGGLARAWRQLASEMDLAGVPVGRQVAHPAGRRTEAGVLAQQAKWFLGSCFFRDAYDLAGASYILGNHSEELLRTMTEAAIGRLPILRNRCSDHINSNPRSLDPAIRFRLGADIPHYLALCQSARLYAAKIKGQLATNSRIRGQVVTRAFTYNEVLSHALDEIHFWRSFMDDCLLRNTYDRELRALDSEISLLTTEYLAQAEGHRSEAETLKLLAFGISGQYYACQNPELLQAMLGRVVELAEPEPHGSAVDSLLMRLAEMSGDTWWWEPAGSNAAKPFYATAVTRLEALRATSARKKVCLTKIERLWAPTTEDRIRTMRKLLGLYPLAGAQKLDDSGRDWERLLGCERQPIGSNLLSDSHYLHGGIASLITHPGEGFVSTGEFARLAGWYVSAAKWDHLGQDKLEKFIATQVDMACSGPVDERLSPAEVGAFRTYLEETGKLTPAITRALDHLAPRDENPAPATDATVAVPLTPLMVLPDFRGMAQFARVGQATLDGDELWMPATYFESGRDINSHPRGCRHAIHVIDLANKSARTVMFPYESSADGIYVDTTQRSSDPARVRHVVLGDHHAYFLIGTPRFSKSYCIDRRSLAVEDVELPLPYVISMSANPSGDTVFLSVAEKWRSSTDPGTKGPNSVVSVEGSKVTATLISNQRKPPQGPLDDPSTWIDSIHLAGNRLTLISNKDMGYVDPKSYKGVIHELGSGKWISLTRRQLEADRTKMFKDQRLHYCLLRNVSNGEWTGYMTVGAGHPGAFVLAKNPIDAMNFRSTWLTTPSKADKVQLIPVSVEPVPSEAIMDRNMYALAEPLDTPGPTKTSGLFRFPVSANEVIEAEKYDVWVFGKWRDRFIVCLTNRGIAMPAIWTMKESDVQRLMDSTSGSQ